MQQFGFSSFPEMVWPDGDPIITVYFKHLEGTLVAWRVQVHESGWEDWEEVRLEKLCSGIVNVFFPTKHAPARGYFHVLDPISHLMDSWTDARCFNACFLHVLSCCFACRRMVDERVGNGLDP